MSGISRRQMLAQTVVLTGTAGLLPTLPAAEAPSGSGRMRSNKGKVIVTGGHPGDPEYGCGGSIARLTNSGHEVVLLYLNQGDPKATVADNPEAPRVFEAGKACAVL